MGYTDPEYYLNGKKIDPDDNSGSDDNTGESNLKFEITGDNTCAVVSRDGGYSGNIVIPEYVTIDDKVYSVTAISEKAFSKCNNLTSVTIPNSVTEIGVSAFESCHGLRSVTIPNSLTKIDDYTFWYCTSLTSVEIPGSVTSIGAFAFRTCNSLTSVNIPNSVTSIGNGAFASCSGLTSVEIPNSVTSIGDGAFEESPKKSIYVEDVAQIRMLFNRGIVDADYYLNGELLTSPKDGCLYAENGTKLICVPFDIQNIIIPEGVTTICKQAFAGCYLESLTIPASIEKVEEDAFSYFTNENGEITNFYAERVNFADFTKWYDNVELGNFASNPYRYSAAYDADGNQIATPEIEEGMEAIPDYKNAGLIPFMGQKELPSSLKRIGAYAFYNSTELYSVIMREGLEEIGESAFEGCELLENSDFPSTLISIEDRAFKSCLTLTEITLPEGLTNLGVSVFKNCSKIEKAVLAANIDVVSDSLFSDCVALNKVYFPIGLKTIGSHAFIWCPLEEVLLPSTLEAIGESAFSCCSLSKLVIPNNVTSLGNMAFWRNNISDLTIGSGLEVIPYGAFFNNSSMKVINFSEGLKEIQKKAFNECNPISVNLPSTVTTIAEEAFGGQISEMVIPDNVTELPFSSCGTPTLLTIGSGVEAIAPYAFNFDNLRVLRVKADNPPTLSEAFAITEDQNAALTMIVNDGCLTKYQNHPRWRQIKNIIEVSSSEIVINMTGNKTLSDEIRSTTGLMPASITKMKVTGPLTETDLRVIRENMVLLQSLDMSEVTNVTKIPDNQFNGSQLSEIKLPQGLTSIGNNAFSECPLLKITELPEGLTEIGSGAFYNTPQVSISILPSSLEAIGLGAFEKCIGIRSIKAGESLVSMGGSAFKDCSILESVDLSETALTEILPFTFLGCRELEEVNLPASVKSIGEQSFYDTAIRDISFAANVSTIEINAFRNCRRLIAANLPKSITSVSSHVFADCPKLIAVSMPAGTVTVADNVFNGDKKLVNISCAAVEAPAAETGAFDNIRDRYVHLVVPTQSYSSYFNAPQWGKFLTIENVDDLETSLVGSFDKDTEVTGVLESYYQEVIREMALEDAAKNASKEPAAESAQVISRRVARRAAARASMQDGKHFASLFDGALIDTGSDDKGFRIFVHPQEGVKVTSILYNDQEMIQNMEGNSLLLPSGSTGSLEIRTDSSGTSEIKEISAGINSGAACQVYDLSGVMVGTSVEGLAPGIYIVRQGNKTTKVCL